MAVHIDQESIGPAFKKYFSSKMNIAMDAYHAFFSSGGIARYARSLVTALSPMTAPDRLILFYNRFRGGGKYWRPVGENTIIHKAVIPRCLLQKACLRQI